MPSIEIRHAWALLLVIHVPANLCIPDILEVLN